MSFHIDPVESMQTLADQDDTIAISCNLRGSSSIVSFSFFGYRLTYGQLTVQFSSGHTYRYDRVKTNDVLGLLLAESVGSVFHSMIVNGGYGYTKLS